MHAFKRNSNGNYFRKSIVYFLVCAITLNAFMPAVFALEAGNIVNSSGIIGEPTWGDHTVIDTQNGAIINWNNFNTNSSQTVKFQQYDGTDLSSFSAVLNRINSGSVPTQFNGTLNANGRVFIVNPAGVIFGSGSTVNVSQLVASGLNMSNCTFSTIIADENNSMLFHGGGDVINNGTINAEQSVYLVGENVINNGAIHCPGGLVVMAAGDKLRLGQRAGNVIVNVDNDLIAGSNNRITNNGTIGEDHSPVAKLVLAAGDIFSQAINNVAEVAAIARGNVELGSIIETTDTDFLGTGDLLTQVPDNPNVDPDIGGSDPDPEPDSQLTSLQRLWQIDAKLRFQTEDESGKAPAAQAALLAAAPIPDDPELQVSGCPALTKWAAKELGINGGTAQISFAGSPASAAGIPPCDACAGLKRSAAILRDYSGVHIAALSGVINEHASSVVPLTEEQEAMITVAIADGAENNAEYALAEEYLDALADYVAILNNGMNLSAADSTEFVLNKYIEPLIENENTNLAPFLAAKLTASPSS